jgi:hypothetical protein
VVNILCESSVADNLFFADAGVKIIPSDLVISTCHGIGLDKGQEK